MSVQLWRILVERLHYKKKYTKIKYKYTIFVNKYTNKENKQKTLHKSRAFWIPSKNRQDIQDWDELCISLSWYTILYKLQEK